MGWKGAVRSIGASIRAAERDAKRRQRELDKQQKHYEKMEALEQASYEVEVYKNEIEIIQSLHKECSDHINWKQIAALPKPKEPAYQKQYENLAISKLNSYKPGLIDRLFKQEDKKTNKLKDQISEAIENDQDEYKNNLSKWEEALKGWKKSQSLASRLLNGEPEAKSESIKEFNSFSEISSLGSSVDISMHEQGEVEATIYVLGNDIVPTEVKSLLKSGKLSKKNMPKGMFYEIYQDYVCSCALRVANEIFAVIPDDLVIITAVDNLLNKQTGHLEKLPILSACISRSTLESLNMMTLDPSDSMNNFIHNMSFKKTKGFEAVSKVDFNALQ